MSPATPSGKIESPISQDFAPSVEHEAAPAQNAAPLLPGQRWHVYQIGERIEGRRIECFTAINVGLLEDAVVTVRPLGETSAMRAATWSRLQEKKIPGLVETIEAIEENGRRYEAFHPPPPTTLRGWFASHRPEADELELVVRQCSEILHALHAAGIGHFNLTPDTIHLHAEDEGLCIVIGGLEDATLLHQPGLVPLHVDPFFAPPEAAGLFQHSPGAGLAAWDWWSLGRVVQELILGQPVLGLVLERDVSARTPDLHARAMELLEERDPAAPRAGAVERMPSMDDRLARLLRGLLTTARDARWGFAEIQGSLRGEMVKDRYGLSRDERLFRWHGCTYSVEEAAGHFSGADAWGEGVEQLFALDDPTRFIGFLGSDESHAHLRKQLDELRELLQLPEWRDFPAGVVRTAIAAASWLQIGQAGSRLQLCGHPVDSASLRTLLQTIDAKEGVALLRAITAPPFVQLISTRDPESGRLLSQLERQVSEVLALGGKLECLSESNPADLAAVYVTALETDAALAHSHDELRKTYACSRHAGLQALFEAAQPLRRDLLLLATVGRNAARFGFATHQEWSGERYMTLRNRGEQIAAKLFWTGLERALRAGPFVFSRLPVVVSMWVALGVGVVICGGSPWSAVVVAGVVGGLFGLRLASCSWHRRSVGDYARERTAWTLRSDNRRCREEANTLLPGETAMGALGAELLRINQEISTLVLDGPVEPLRVPPRSVATWAASAGSWLLVFAALGWSVSSRIAAGTGSNAAAATAQVAEAVASSSHTEEPKPTAAPLTPEERFFNGRQAGQAAWIFPEPASAPQLAVKAQVVPTSDQVAAALVEGQRLLLPYASGDTRGVIAVPVEVDGEPGLMLFDAERRRLVERRIFKLSEFPPAAKAWFELNRRKVLYFGDAPPPVLTAGIQEEKPDLLP